MITLLYLDKSVVTLYISAVMLVLLLLVFVLFTVVNYKRKQQIAYKENQLKESEHQNQLLQKELEKQKLIEQERERISHDMHDDLGAGISALKLQAEFLKQKAKDNDLIDDINELLKTSEEMNISMREMLWSLNSGNDTLGSFVNYAKLYSENFLKKSKIKLNVSIENIQNDKAISTEQRRNLFLCLKEALNNAYKHSEASQVHLSLIQKDKEFMMKISDNGIGINPENSKGNGLRNMHRRMDEQNGQCEIFNENGTNLIFKIEV